MKANDLRIGNLVYVDNVKSHPQLKDALMIVTAICNGESEDKASITVKRLNKDEFDVYSDYGQLIKFIKPVPITEHNLLEYDFKYNEPSSSYILEVGIYTIQVLIREHGDIEINIIDNFSGSIYLGYRDYIHDLQNIIYILTKVELELSAKEDSHE